MAMRHGESMDTASPRVTATPQRHWIQYNSNDAEATQWGSVPGLCARLLR